MSPSNPLPSLHPVFHPSPHSTDSPSITSLVQTLHLTPHIEGGYFIETDRAPDTVPSPFPPHKSSSSSSSSTTSDLAPLRPGFNPLVRNSSTTIFYLLTPNGPQGGFHRNKGRTVHTLHRGRGRYVVIHADADGEGNGNGGPGKRVESFVVGQDVGRGERLQWIVEGGKYKASFLLDDRDGEGTSDGLLISETVVPGFEFCDHDFLTEEGLVELVGREGAGELKWLLRRE